MGASKSTSDQVVNRLYMVETARRMFMYMVFRLRDTEDRDEKIEDLELQMIHNLLQIKKSDAEAIIIAIKSD